MVYARSAFVVVGLRARGESGVGTTTAAVIVHNGMEYRTLSSRGRIVKHPVTRCREARVDFVRADLLPINGTGRDDRPEIANMR
jgi:hypothetical protein